jgi:hypothetical protein
MDYTLNINKALKKKLKATQRNRTLQYKYTGGGIVIPADAASFELFEMVSITYYEKPSLDGTTIIDSMFGMSVCTNISHHSPFTRILLCVV